jgi:hypothetical protein
MRAFVVAAVTAVALISGPAWALSPITFEASPNPAIIGEQVAFTVSVQGIGTNREQIWVAARGLGKPTMGDLPPGSWSYECCPAETGFGPAWHFRSYTSVFPGTHSFEAEARQPGLYTNTAAFGPYRASLTLRIL